MARARELAQSVFINVPFGRRGKKLLGALMFAVHHRGLAAPCSLASDDGSLPGGTRTSWSGAASSSICSGVIYREEVKSTVCPVVVRSTNASRSEVWPVVAGVAEAPPHWSREGKALYFIARDSMRAAMVAPGADFRIASTKVLFPRGALEPDFDVTPDGRFVMARPLASSAPAVHLVMIENWARVTP